MLIDGASCISLSSGSKLESGLSLTSSPDDVIFWSILLDLVCWSKNGFLLAWFGADENGLDLPIVLNFPPLLPPLFPFPVLPPLPLLVLNGLALIRSWIFFSSLDSSWPLVCIVPSEVTAQLAISRPRFLFRSQPGVPS